MKHQIATTAFAILASTTAVWADAGYHTGMVAFEIADAARGLDGFVWYPTAQVEGGEVANGNKVWQGIEVMRDAPLVAGVHPLVVLSHGMFGNANNQAWLAQALVARGYIVAAVNHPGTSSFNKDPDQRRMLWERPRDISRVIDYVLGGAGIGAAVEPDRIFMAGHSLGGFTAVALAGGRFSGAAYDASCAAAPDDLACGIFQGWQIAKTPEDLAAMEADVADPRIAGFAVFDLGGAPFFSAESLAGVARPMLVVGAPDDVHRMDLGRESRGLKARLPKGAVTYLEPEGLAHFDFLGECTEIGLEILKEEEPDDAFVCEKGRDERVRDHAAIVAAVTAFFDGI
jgi:predicted dienelactone hydrolase